MTRKTIFLPLLAATALLLAACTGDDPLVNPKGEGTGGTGQPLAHLASGPAPASSPLAAPEAFAVPQPFGLPGLKTYLHSEGQFCWAAGDNVFVNVNGTWTAPYKNSIAGRQARADFWMDCELTENTYQVVYTGNGNAKHNEVTIPASQPVPTATDDLGTYTSFNNSEQVQFRGDCGTATATLNEADNTYYFDIDHKACYLLLLPTTMEAPVTDCDLERIVIRGDGTHPITGTFPFSFAGGLDVDNGAGTGHEISIDVWMHLNETIDTLINRPDIATSDPSSPLYDPTVRNVPEDGIYVVIAPGTEYLTIEYYVRYFTLQSCWWNAAALMWEYDYTSGKGFNLQNPYRLPEGEYAPGGLEGLYKFTRRVSLYESSSPTASRAFAPNDFVRINHKLSLIRPDYIYDFQDYYQWDAQGTFWSGWNWSDNLGGYSYSYGSGYPYSSDFPLSNQDSVLVRYEDYAYTSAFQGYALKNGGTYRFNGTDEQQREDMYNSADATRTAATMPNANEITWWLQYGKAHRDNTTTWWMRGYHNRPTLCQSGVWFLKRSKLVDNAGNSVTPDPTRAAPMFEQAFTAGDIDLNYDLREGTPATNLRRYFAQPYDAWGRYPRTDASLSDEWGYNALRKPDDTADYFFLPSFGYYLMREPEPAGNFAPSESAYCTSEWEFPTDYRNAQMKLVGVRGHYWSSTPWRRVMPAASVERDNSGKVPVWYSNNAYYLYSNEDYVSLSWYGAGGNNERQWGYIAGYREDGTSWFK